MNSSTVRFTFRMNATLLKKVKASSLRVHRSLLHPSQPNAEKTDMNSRGLCGKWSLRQDQLLSESWVIKIEAGGQRTQT